MLSGVLPSWQRPDLAAVLPPAQEDAFPSCRSTRCAPSPWDRCGSGLCGSPWVTGVMVGSLNVRWSRTACIKPRASLAMRGGRYSSELPAAPRPCPPRRGSQQLPGHSKSWGNLCSPPRHCDSPAGDGRGHAAAHPTESSPRAAPAPCPTKSSPNRHKTPAKQGHACGMNTALLPARTLPTRSWADGKFPTAWSAFPRLAASP